MQGKEELKVFRELKQIKGSKYELTIKQGPQTNIIEYEKDQLKEAYGELQLNKNNMLAKRTKLESQIATNDVEDTPALREFVEKLESAKALMDKQGKELELKVTKEKIIEINDQLRELEGAIPELKRKK